MRRLGYVMTARYSCPSLRCCNQLARDGRKVVYAFLVAVLRRRRRKDAPQVTGRCFFLRQKRCPGDNVLFKFLIGGTAFMGNRVPNERDFHQFVGARFR